MVYIYQVNVLYVAIEYWKINIKIEVISHDICAFLEPLLFEYYFINTLLIICEADLFVTNSDMIFNRLKTSFAAVLFLNTLYLCLLIRLLMLETMILQFKVLDNAFLSQDQTFQAAMYKIYKI